MTLDLRELAWASGVFEGEGSFGGRVMPSGRRFISTTFTSTDLDVVQRIQHAFGFGAIYSRQPHRLGSKLQYTWQAATFEQVQQVIAALWFGLSTRRKARARKLLTDYTSVVSEIDCQRRRREEIAQALRDHRFTTQAALAAHFKVSAATVARIKKGVGV